MLAHAQVELRERAGAWNKKYVTNGGGLNHPVSHCYAIHLAM